VTPARRPTTVCCLLLALVLALPAGAGAVDPGRWNETGYSRIPLNYYQGITSDPQRNLYFDGIYVGLYRTDPDLRETGRTDNVIPPDVLARERYNHIGDISWDDGEGGRVLLPLECYYPGTPGGGNTCQTGSIGVADPQALRWRYYVKLDPAEIPKAMWVEVDERGELAWTSAGSDLLAYRVSDLTAANAAPAAPPIQAVRRLPGAVPPTGITGAAFRGGRLYVAGQQIRLFQVWSIDLSDGSRRLEIERQIVGESEGIDFVDVLGGELHWMILPYNPQGEQPTYGPTSGALLHFAATAQAGDDDAEAGGRISLSLSPRSVPAGRRSRVVFRAVDAASRRPVGGARVAVAGRRARTNSRGRAAITLRIRRAGRYRARAAKSGMRAGAAWLYVTTAPRFTG
jgi:hypothetical protein